MNGLFETLLIRLPHRRFSLRCGFAFFLLPRWHSRGGSRLNFALFFLPALQDLLFALFLSVQRTSLIFVLPVDFFGLHLARRLRPFGPLPFLQHLAFSRLLSFQLALFGLFAAAHLFDG